MQRGICVTCARGQLCTYPPAFQGVTQCEEYEEAFSLDDARPRRTRKSVSFATDGERESRGLCASCNVRSACTYPKNGIPTAECADYC